MLGCARALQSCPDQAPSGEKQADLGGFVTKEPRWDAHEPTRFDGLK